MTPLGRLLMMMARAAAGASTPAYKSIGTALAATGTLGLPASHSAGDILLIACTGGNGQYATPAGWTAASTHGSSPRQSVFWKVDSGSESAVSMTGGGSAGQCVMLAYTGISGLDTNGTLASVNSANAVTNSLTTTAANSIVINIFSEDNTGTTPGSITGNTIRYANNSTGRSLVVSDEVKAVAGATTARTCTFGTSAANDAFALSFKP